LSAVEIAAERLEADAADFGRRGCIEVVVSRGATRLL
jgi:hypothetical protein